MFVEFSGFESFWWFFGVRGGGGLKGSGFRRSHPDNPGLGV